jgi:hypothetical protein
MCQSDGAGNAAMAENCLVRECLGNHMAQEVTSGGKWDAYTIGETSVGMHQLEEVFEMSCSDFLVHTTEMCKGTPSDQWVSSYKG